MIKTGTVLHLHGKEDYRVGDFCFDVSESTGNFQAYVTLVGVNDEKKDVRYPIWMIEELMNRGELYLAEQKEMMAKFHEARARRAS